MTLSQTLSFNSGTQILTISDGNTADLSSLLDNTDAQSIALNTNILSISGSAGTVDLSAYPKRAIIYRESADQIINIAPIINTSEINAQQENKQE